MYAVVAPQRLPSLLSIHADAWDAVEAARSAVGLTLDERRPSDQTEPAVLYAVAAHSHTPDVVLVQRWIVEQRCPVLAVETAIAPSPAPMEGTGEGGKERWRAPVTDI